MTGQKKLNVRHTRIASIDGNVKRDFSARRDGRTLGDDTRTLMCYWFRTFVHVDVVLRCKGLRLDHRDGGGVVVNCWIRRARAG